MHIYERLLREFPAETSPLERVQRMADVSIAKLREMADSFISVGRQSRNGRTASRYGRRAQALQDAANLMELLVQANRTLYSGGEPPLSVPGSDGGEGK